MAAARTSDRIGGALTAFHRATVAYARVRVEGGPKDQLLDAVLRLVMAARPLTEIGPAMVRASYVEYALPSHILGPLDALLRGATAFWEARAGGQSKDELARALNDVFNAAESLSDVHGYYSEQGRPLALETFISPTTIERYAEKWLRTIQRNRNAAQRRRTPERDAKIQTLVASYRKKYPHPASGRSTRAMAALIARRLKMKEPTVRRRLQVLGLK